MTAFTLFIGNKNYSSWSMRAWLAAKLAGAEFEEVVIRLGEQDTRAKILAVSPAGRVPALKQDGLILWDTLAIAEYLVEAYPDRQLWPRERAARAHARSLCAEMHAGFAALRTALAFNARRDGPAPRLDDAARQDIARILAMWGECRERHRRSGSWLFGPPSLADAFYAPVVSRFLSYRIPLEGAVGDYVRTVTAWPAFQEWIAGAKAEPWRVAKWEK